MNADEKLREILRAQGDSVEPSAAGWDRITQGVALRRRRRMWLRSSLAAATALSLVAVVALTVTRDSDNRANEIIPATTAPSPDSSSAATAPDSTTSIAVWPLTTEAEVAAWKADPAGYEFLGDRGATALAFAKDYLGLATPAIDTSGERVVVRRTAEDADRPIYVGTLDMAGGGERPYLVTGMSADGVTITGPRPGYSVTRSFSVSGTFAGADQVIDVELRTAPSAGGKTIAKARATIGPAGWHAILEHVSTVARTGSLLVTTDSGLDGGLAGSVAMRIAFAEETRSAPSARTAPPINDRAYPAQFVAVEDGRIGLYDTKTGARVRFLTEPLTMGGIDDLSVTPDGKAVVYVRGTGSCAFEDRRVAITGGDPDILVGVNGRTFSSPVLSSQNDLAYVDSYCQGGDGAVSIVVQRAQSPRTNRSDQRVVESRDPASTLLGLSWSADGANLAAVLIRFGHDGDSSSVRALDVSTKVVDDAPLLAETTPDSDPGCAWRDTAASRRPRFVGVMVCGDGTARPPSAYAMELTGARPRVITSFEPLYATTISADTSGDHLLFETRTADDVRAVYRFSVDGDPIKVADNLTQPAWVL